MKIRQIITGHDEKGRSVFVQDGNAEPVGIGEGVEIAFLWSADEPATFPGPGKNPAAPDFFPPIGGYRFIIASIPREFEENGEWSGEGVGEVMGRDAPGFHTTDTTDFEVILTGRVSLELDDGAEVVLSPGDVVVQNGTRHRWRSVGEEEATMAVFMVGANPRPEGP